MSYIDDYLAEVKTIASLIDRAAIERTIDILIDIREKKGRLFFLGVGGGAGNASHAVNDFRKIAGIESYAPTDNVSELTARINDDGWETSFAAWLRGSNLTDKDGVFVLSVGGGNREKNVSINLVKALEYARKIGARIVGIVGRDGGYTAQVADSCIIIPVVNSRRRHPAYRGFSERHLAPDRLRPAIAHLRNEVGIDEMRLSNRTKAVFLDRDGVVNELVYFPEQGIIDSPFIAGQFRLCRGVPGRLKNSSAPVIK